MDFSISQSFLPSWNNQCEHEENLPAGSAASVGKVSTAGDSEKMTKYLVSAGAITYSSWESSTEMGNSNGRQDLYDLCSRIVQYHTGEKKQIPKH
jgi:hypothetical protein